MTDSKLKLTWTLEAEMRRQEGRKWLAKVVGIDPDNRSGLAFEFLNPISSEFGKVGTRKAVFEIIEPGYYYDSDGDYIRVFESEDKLDYESTSSRDIKAALAGVGEPID